MKRTMILVLVISVLSAARITVAQVFAILMS
jgi:hypothetical protein